MAERLELHTIRHMAVLEVLKESGATSVIDLGCGNGRFLQLLIAEPRFTRIAGVDVSARLLDRAREYLGWERLPERQKRRVQLFQSSLVSPDVRLGGYDAGVLNEVIEHLRLEQVPLLEEALFGAARLATIVVTTPNREYNRLYNALTVHGFRHPDHRFEWTRAEFQAWADEVAARRRYTVQLSQIGPVDPFAGAPTQMAVFRRKY